MDDPQSIDADVQEVFTAWVHEDPAARNRAALTINADGSGHCITQDTFGPISRTEIHFSWDAGAGVIKVIREHMIATRYERQIADYEGIITGLKLQLTTANRRIRQLEQPVVLGITVDCTCGRRTYNVQHDPAER